MSITCRISRMNLIVQDPFPKHHQYFLYYISCKRLFFSQVCAKCTLLSWQPLFHIPWIPFLLVNSCEINRAYFRPFFSLILLLYARYTAKVFVYMPVCPEEFSGFYEVLIRFVIGTGLVLRCTFAFHKHVFIVMFKTRPTNFKWTIIISSVNNKSGFVGYLCVNSLSMFFDWEGEASVSDSNTVLIRYTEPTIRFRSVSF